MKKWQRWILFSILFLFILTISACTQVSKPSMNHSIKMMEQTSLHGKHADFSFEKNSTQTRFEPIPLERDEIVTVEQQEEFEPQISYVTKTHVNLREGPSTDYRIITTVPAGERVVVSNESEYWFEVEYGQYSGYISALYVKPVITASTENEGLSKDYTSSASEKRIPILMYHAIDEYKGKGIKELYVTPENFKAQMEYIKSEGFTPITFEDLPYIDRFEKPIMITFDDGYKNNMNAYEILKEMTDSQFQGKATIFMVGKKIDTKSGLSTAQLKEISSSGIISVQSHTETHPNLTETTNLTPELRDIKWKLENITGKPVIAFAYPSGKYDERVIAETKKYYKYAVTTMPGIASLNNPYELKRIRINYSTSLETFIQHLQ
ncbi:polysaccharide deacetylase family protein [Fervidibacillus halotolerans]|uniref:Polysaccharide deacetylase family protein n=1 Tax=Fervidibacillus halotolerans TaxID=2980027 RepID=A0A9E8LYM0_9BACI|nr:polysaccharide deacetylase family protein [Fervidibacillus halotolerans]WAA11812.1 polysaccharide deacetylase family protein [Fervidibacillus halotolerans]